MTAPRIATVTLNAAIDKRYVVPGLRAPGVNRVAECTYSAGGKGLNVARVAAIAGAQVTATGFLGGHAGAFIAEQLASQGITDRCVRVAGESRSCINICDPTTGEVTELLEPGCGVGNTDIDRLLGQVRALLPAVDVLTLSGSAPQGAPADIYAQLIALAHDAGRPVILDTSSPWLEPGIAAGPTLIKPNEDEIAQLLAVGPGGATGGGAGENEPGGRDPIEAARRVCEAGVEYVVLSRGARGAVLVTRDGAESVRPPRIEAVNTVGCGDAMVAALAIGLALGREPRELLRHAVAISAAAALDPGTGAYDPHVASQLLAQI